MQFICIIHLYNIFLKKAKILYFDARDKFLRYLYVSSLPLLYRRNGVDESNRLVIHDLRRQNLGVSPTIVRQTMRVALVRRIIDPRVVEPRELSEMTRDTRASDIPWLQHYGRTWHELRVRRLLCRSETPVLKFVVSGPVRTWRQLERRVNASEWAANVNPLHSGISALRSSRYAARSEKYLYLCQMHDSTVV